MEQIDRLDRICRQEGVALHHVKPHGALYNQASRDRSLAQVVAQAVFDYSPDLILVGMTGGELVAAGGALGLRVVREGFIDRRYETDGSLTPRSQAHAVIEQSDAALAQLHQLVLQQKVLTRQQIWLPMSVETLCLHGDNPEGLRLAKACREVLEAAGIAIRPIEQGRFHQITGESG
jgi:UPF0271 protein